MSTKNETARGVLSWPRRKSTGQVAITARTASDAYGELV